MNKPFQHSAGAYMQVTEISPASDISVYCRVCPKPSFPSYHKKGMLPRLQGTIELKALSRLFWQNTSFARTFSPSRETRLQAHLCYPINPSSLPFLFAFVNCSMVWIFSALRFSCFPFCHPQKTRKATQHKSNINTVFPKVVPISEDTCPNGFKLFIPS